MAAFEINRHVLILTLEFKMRRLTQITKQAHILKVCDRTIQRAEMSVIFDERPKTDTGIATNHFTLETDAVGGTGLWYALCELVEIKNGSKQAEVIST